MIKISCENSLSLVNDLLEVDTPIQDQDRKAVDLHELVHYCVALMQHKADAKGQRIVVRTSTIILQVNPETMWRVICNLIGNAIKFSPTGGII